VVHRGLRARVDPPEWQRLERQARFSEQRHLLKRAHKAVRGETRDELRCGGRTGSVRGTTLATSAFGDGGWIGRICRALNFF